LQLAEPISAANIPVAHFVQLEDAGEAWALPVKQLTHSLAPIAEYLPARQFVQLGALDLLAVPAPQSAQTVDPVEAEYVPSVHATHEVEPVASWAKPIAHSLHFVETAAAE